MSGPPTEHDREGSAPGAALLRVDILGPPVMTIAGTPLVVDTRKASALLAVLAVGLADGVPMLPRSQAAALLWPDADDAHARAALRRTLSVLVAAVGSAVVSDRVTVALEPTCVTSDVVTFRRLSGSDDREDLARAVGLIRGQFLAGFALRDSPAFDEWTAATSERLRHQLGGVQERLVLARLRHGELHAGLADAGRWLELDPLHEPAHRSVMRLLAWTGRRQDALDHYHRTVRILNDELGVAPVRATTEVYEAIRAGTLPPPRRPTARQAGPAPIATSPSTTNSGALHAGEVAFTGRADELARLRSAINEGRTVVVTGEAGAGRTRLIDELVGIEPAVVVVRAHEGEALLSYAAIADLLRSVLATTAEPLPVDVATEISRLLPELIPVGADPPPPLTTPGARDRFYDAVVRAVAASTARAVVIEDVHAVGAAGAAVIAYLVHRASRLGRPLILTWRDPGLPVRHPVRSALTSGRQQERTVTIALDRLARADVVQLAASFGLDGDAIWRDTAGLPLLVAAAMRTGGEDLPATVRDVLSGRLAEVAEETGQVLAALAVLGGVADPGDLHAVSGRSEDEVVEAVEEALRSGLLREDGARVAFSHDALRRVTDEQLSLLRRRRLHRRAADVLRHRRDAIRHAAEIADHAHRGGDDELAADWAWRAAEQARSLFAHEEALRQLEFASSVGYDRSELPLAEGDVLVALARYEPARDAYARALAMTADRLVRADVERRLADIALRQGEWQRAAAGLTAAVELAGEADIALRARLLADRAVVANRAGDLDDAVRFAADAVSAGIADDPYVLDVAGIVALSARDVVGALAYFRAALAADPDLALEVAIVNNLSAALAASGEIDAAVDSARTALQLGRRHGDRHRLAALLTNLADRLHAAAELASPAPPGSPAPASREAMALLTESAALFAEVGADPLHRPDVWTLTTW